MFDLVLALLCLTAMAGLPWVVKKITNAVEGVSTFGGSESRVGDRVAPEGCEEPAVGLELTLDEVDRYAEFSRSDTFYNVSLGKSSYTSTFKELPISNMVLDEPLVETSNPKSQNVLSLDQFRNERKNSA